MPHVLGAVAKEEEEQEQEEEEEEEDRCVARLEEG